MGHGIGPSLSPTIFQSSPAQIDQWHFIPPKTSHGVRAVPLLPEAVDRLRRHRAEQAQRLLRLGIRATDDDVVCDRGDVQPIDPSTYTHAASRMQNERSSLVRW